MIQAPIHKIISHSLVDGPGNRTSIFLQGCNIACRYCHNPETQAMCGSSSADLEYTLMTAEEVYERVKVDIPFIRGITLSGGECMLYPDFIEELFVKCQKLNITTLIDTNGTIDFSKFEGLMKVTSGVMLDVKAWDKDVFNKLTKGNNEVVKKNLKYLSEIDKIEEIRIVCIPDEVDVIETLEGIKETIGDKVSSVNIKLIKFRNNGVIDEKFKKIKTPTDEYMNNLGDKARELGFINIKI